MFNFLDLKHIHNSFQINRLQNCQISIPKASNEMCVPLNHRITFSAASLLRVAMSVYMYVTKSKHEQTNKLLTVWFGTLSKPSKNPLKCFLDGARNSRLDPKPKITGNKNMKKG